MPPDALPTEVLAGRPAAPAPVDDAPFGTVAGRGVVPDVAEGVAPDAAEGVAADVPEGGVPDAELAPFLAP